MVERRRFVVTNRETDERGDVVVTYYVPSLDRRRQVTIKGAEYSLLNEEALITATIERMEP